MKTTELRMGGIRALLADVSSLVSMATNNNSPGLRVRFKASDVAVHALRLAVFSGGDVEAVLSHMTKELAEAAEELR